MFLSHAVVPVFVFTILLNFFCLYSPIHSQQAPPTGGNFTTCQDCLNSTCRKNMNGTCGVNNDNNNTFSCITCTVNPAGHHQFISETACRAACTDKSKECVCDGPCYTCAPSAGLNKAALICTSPKIIVDGNCTKIPNGAPGNGTTKV